MTKTTNEPEVFFCVQIRSERPLFSSNPELDNLVRIIIIIIVIIFTI